MIRAAFAFKRTVLLLLSFVFVTGIYAYIAIPKESEPDIQIPIIYVSIHHEGISPEDAERQLVQPMETHLRGIEGVKEMRSTAYLSGANIVLEFHAGFDSSQALGDVREKVDIAKADLPVDAEEPTVSEVNLSEFPVLVVTLSGDVPERTLLQLARRLRDQVEGISAVLEAKISGNREEVVEIEIDPMMLESYNISAIEVGQIVTRSNALIAAGVMDSGAGRYPLKVPGLFDGARDILQMPVKQEGDRVVQVGDIATVKRTFRDAESLARIDGEKAIALEISKRTGENIIETIEQVRAVVAAEQQYWPENVIVTFSQDKSHDIRQMLADLQNNVISAVLLVMVVVVAALGWRAAGLVGVAIPGSFLLGILTIYLLGFTVNIVVLFSLILAVGMLVDGAIVVVEYADRRMLAGLSRKQAYLEASQRMTWPIIASTATTLTVFLPLIFWPGVVGEFMKFLPITLLATLSASLLMALIFIPVLGALIGKPNAGLDMPAFDQPQHLDMVQGLGKRYLGLLTFALRHPGKIILSTVALLVVVQVVYAIAGRGVEFFPEIEPETAIIKVQTRGNLSVAEKDQLVQQVEALVYQSDCCDSVYVRSGEQMRGGQESAEDVIGQIQLEFKDWQLRPKASTILADIVSQASDIAGIVVETQEQQAGPGEGKPIHLELSSRDATLLSDAVAHIRAVMDKIGGFVNVEDSRPIPAIEWQLTVDRVEAMKFGADVLTVGNAIRLITNGLRFDEFIPDGADEEVDLVARYPEPYRNLKELDNLRVQTEQGMIPISNFVTRTAQQKVSEIHRTDSQRVLSIKADVAEGLLADSQLKALQEALTADPFNPQVSLNLKGEQEDQQETGAFLAKAFGIALFIMLIILVTQFNSFFSAGLILSSVVMSTIGVFIGLLLTGQPFGMVMCGIGVIALAGIVVNNNIILIDTYDSLRRSGIAAREAILLTGVQRLRPVLLTSGTTVLGLLPMVLSLNIDFINRDISYGAPSTQWWVQLSTVITFGLSFATILTLIFTPCALLVWDNCRAWAARQYQRRRAAVARHV